MLSAGSPVLELSSAAVLDTDPLELSSPLGSVVGSPLGSVVGSLVGAPVGLVETPVIGPSSPLELASPPSEPHAPVQSSCEGRLALV